MNIKEINEIINKSKNYKNIYFDCFDTLIKRKYSINFCFYKLADMLILEYNFPIEHKLLYNSLINFYSKCDVDFSIIVKDIYLHYYKYINVPFEKFVNNFKKTFIDAELENIELNGDINLLLSKLKNKNLYIISDYYLGSDIIELYLNKLLGNNPFKKIFVSSDLHAKKSDGSLYKVVKSINDSIMIGDNKNSDIFNSSKIGLATYKVNSNNNYYKYILYDLNYETRCVKSLYNLRDKCKKTYVSNFSFDLFLFCKKLYANLNKNDTVYFLSRDGFFMKKCFDYYLTYNNNKNIQTKYFEVSRLAMFLPTLKFDELNAENFKKELLKHTQWKFFCLDDLLNALGFSKDDKKLFSNIHIKYPNFLETKEYEKVFNSKLFLDILKKRIVDSKNRFSDLTKNIKDTFITVDLGWKGVQQNDMRKVLPSNVKLTGYYLGTSSSVGELENSNKIGLIFDHSISPNKLSYFFSVEALLKSDKSQLVSYSKNGDIYIDDSGKEIYNIYSSICQKKAFDIFKKICEYDFKQPIFFSNLNSVMEKIYRKRSVKSIAYGNYYYNYQNCNNFSNKISYKYYLLAIKLKILDNYILSRIAYFVSYVILKKIHTK